MNTYKTDKATQQAIARIFAQYVFHREDENGNCFIQPVTDRVDKDIKSLYGNKLTKV